MCMSHLSTSKCMTFQHIWMFAGSRAMLDSSESFGMQGTFILRLQRGKVQYPHAMGKVLVCEVVLPVHSFLHGFEDFFLLVDEGLAMGESINKIYLEWCDCLNHFKLFNLELIPKFSPFIRDLID